MVLLLSEIIDAFNTTSRYLDDLLYIKDMYFDNMVNQIYPSKFNLIKPIPLILKPRFWICICPFLMTVFLPNIMINVRNLIL